jgi:hypothetical protein
MLTNMPAICNYCFWWVMFLIFSEFPAQMNRYVLDIMHAKSSIKEAKSVTNYILLKQSILLFSLFTYGGNLYLQLDLVQFWQFLVLYPLSTALCNIIYSYKYLESELIKHCHVIFIHSLGQPLIVWSHSKVHAREEIPRKFPRQPHVFPIIVTSLDSTVNKYGVHR